MQAKPMSALEIAAQQFEESVGNMRLIAELLSRQCDTLPIGRRQEYLGAMAATAANLGKMVLALLELRGSAESPAALNRTSLRVSEVIMQGMEAQSAEAERKNVRVTLSAPRDEPHVSADYPRLSQAFDRLLEDVTRAAHEGASVEIELTADDSGVHVALRMENATSSSRGTTPTKNPRVHERVNGGSLGVALAKEVVELHGGTFSEAEHGRLYLFRLPQEPVSVAM